MGAVSDLPRPSRARTVRLIAAALPLSETNSPSWPHFPLLHVLPVAKPIQVAFLSLDAKKASCGARDLHGSLLARFAGQCLASEPPWAAQASNSPAS